MKKNDSGKTAEALMAELNADPGYLERIRLRDEAHAQHAAMLSQAEAPLVAVMRSMGYAIRSVGELDVKIKSYASLIPLLLKEARNQTYPPQILDSIIRALGTRQSLPYWKELVDLLYDKTLNLPPTYEHQGIPGLAVAEAADDSVIDDVIRFAKDVTLGEARRSAMLIALFNSKNPRAKMTLLELRDDSELKRHVKYFRRIARLQSRKYNH